MKKLINILWGLVNRRLRRHRSPRPAFCRYDNKAKKSIVKQTERQTGIVSYASTAKGTFTLNQNTMTRRTLLLLGMLVIIAVPICLYAYCVRYLWGENAKPPLDGYASFMVASALFAAGQLLIAIYTKKVALRFMAISCGLCGIVFGMLSFEGHGLGALIEMLLLYMLPVLIFVEVILVIDAVTERDPVRPG